MFQDIDWLFFDLGETLFDEGPALRIRAGRARDLLAGVGVTVLADDVLARIEAASADFSASPVTDAVVGLSGQRVTPEQVRRSAPYDPADETVCEGAAEVLAALAGRYRLGVIANQTAGAADRLRARGLAGFFAVCATSAELGMAKPSPGIFQYALNAAGCAPAAAVMIGDRIDNDIRPARALGMKTIRLARGYAALQRPRDELERPQLTVRTLAELLRHL